MSNPSDLQQSILNDVARVQALASTEAQAIQEVEINDRLLIAQSVDPGGHRDSPLHDLYLYFISTPPGKRTVAGDRMKLALRCLIFVSSEQLKTAQLKSDNFKLLIELWRVTRFHGMLKEILQIEAHSTQTRKMKRDAFAQGFSAHNGLVKGQAADAARKSHAENSVRKFTGIKAEVLKYHDQYLTQQSVNAAVGKVVTNLQKKDEPFPANRTINRWITAHRK